MCKEGARTRAVRRAVPEPEAKPASLMQHASAKKIPESSAWPLHPMWKEDAAALLRAPASPLPLLLTL